MFISLFVWWYCNAWFSIPTNNQSSGFYYYYNTSWQNYINTDIWSLIRGEIIENEENGNVFQQLLGVFQLKWQSWFGDASEKWKAIYYAKWIINMLLSLTALISLVMIIFAFYLIFFLKDDAWITKAKQVLKWVVLSLFVIWLSRFIVSILFWIERWTTEVKQWDITNWDSIIQEISYLQKDLNNDIKHLSYN